MSSSLIVYLKKKEENIDNGKNGICLLDLSTTPARELYSILSQTVSWNLEKKENENDNDCYKSLSWSLLNQILQYYRDEIQKNKEKLSILNKEIDVLEQRILKIKSVPIYDKISEEIMDIRSNIMYLQEDIDNYETLYNRWNYCVKDVFLENLDYKEYEYVGDEQKPLEEKCKYELVYYLD